MQIIKPKKMRQSLLRDKTNLEDYDYYQKSLWRKKGFSSYTEYLNHLARSKGFTSWFEYQLAKLKHRGIKSVKEHQQRLAHKKGLLNAAEYQKHLANRRRTRPRNRAISNLINSNLARVGRNKNWLSQKLGVSRGTITYYTSGKGIPKQARLRAIKRILEVE